MTSHAPPPTPRPSPGFFRMLEHPTAFSIPEILRVAYEESIHPWVNRPFGPILHPLTHMGRGRWVGKGGGDQIRARYSVGKTP